MVVKDYMQALTLTVAPYDLLSTARRLMSDLLIRHLPVVREGNCLVGILTDRDLRQASPSRGAGVIDHELQETFNAMTVSEVMTQPVYTVSPDTALVEAAILLLDHKFDCLPVVDDGGALQGLITTSDFVRVYVEQHENVMF